MPDGCYSEFGCGEGEGACVDVVVEADDLACYGC